MMRPSVPDLANKFAERSAQVPVDARNSTYLNMSSGPLEQKRRMGDTSDNMNRPSKLARLEDGQVVRSTVNQQTSMIGGSGPIQAVGIGSSPANRISSTEGMQYPEKQAPQVICLSCSSFNFTSASLFLKQEQLVLGHWHT